MLFTPKTKKSFTLSTQSHSKLSRAYAKYSTEANKQFLNQSAIMYSGSNKNLQKFKPVAKLSIQVKKKKVNNSQAIFQAPKIRVNPLKYRPNIISKMSSQQNGNIVAYGVTTLKGYKNVINPHFIGINLGKVKSISLSEAFDGQMAAKIIKQQLNAQLNELQNQCQENTQRILNQTYNRLQQKIIKEQSQIQDNSGTSLLTIVIKNQLITIANAGCSYAICGTKNGSFLHLSQSHTTLNKKQMQRIIKNGASVYQTVVNVPYQQQLKLQGPVRISPSGLMVTRCLGRELDYKRQLNSVPHRVYNPQQTINVTWKPQIKYIKTQEVVWLGIFSQSIINNCSLEYIKGLINAQLNKKNENWTQHQISMEISRKIVEKLASQGVSEAMSAIILILGPLPVLKKALVLKLDQKQKTSRNRINEQSSYERQNKLSLSYRGNRKSFIKSISPNNKNISLTLLVKNSNYKNMQVKKLTKDFSFNNIN